jgi:peptidyl-prolyl cis-trans isomerase B (cyclophilin B)
MDPSTKTLDEEIIKFKQTINPLIESDVLVITGDSVGFVSEYESYVLKANGHFEDKKGIEQNIGFAAVLMKHGNVLYVSQYTNYIDSFNLQEPTFVDILSSIKLFTPQPITSGLDYGQETSELSNETSESLETNEEGGGCLIATAAFGSEMAPQVQFLREIRDGTVMSTESGTTFMTGFNQFYYSFSPYVADYERENPVFKEAVKVTLTPMLTSLTLLNYVNVDSEEEMLGYGIGIILLNIGMYFVAPAAAIIVIKNRIKQQ